MSRAIYLTSTSISVFLVCIAVCNFLTVNRWYTPKCLELACIIELCEIFLLIPCRGRISPTFSFLCCSSKVIFNYSSLLTRTLESWFNLSECLCGGSVEAGPQNDHYCASISTGRVTVQNGKGSPSSVLLQSALRLWYFSLHMALKKAQEILKNIRKHSLEMMTIHTEFHRIWRGVVEISYQHCGHLWALLLMRIIITTLNCIK